MVKLLVIYLWIILHPVHVTLLGIDYSAEKGVFNASLRVYYDDFILDYELLTGKKPAFDFSDNNADERKLVSDYLKDKVVLKKVKEYLSLIK